MMMALVQALVRISKFCDMREEEVLGAKGDRLHWRQLLCWEWQYW